MDNPKAKPQHRITPKSARIVKALVGCFVLLGTGSSLLATQALKAEDDADLNALESMTADPNEPPPPVDLSAETSALTPDEKPVQIEMTPEPEPEPKPQPEVEPAPVAKLPPVEDLAPAPGAKLYPVKVLKKSKTNRVYLFETEAQYRPKPGTILLLKREDRPAMAMRVLRTYVDKNQFASRQVKTYGENRVLKEGETLTALERSGKLAPSPKPQPKANAKDPLIPPEELPIEFGPDAYASEEHDPVPPAAPAPASVSATVPPVTETIPPTVDLPLEGGDDLKALDEAASTPLTADPPVVPSPEPAALSDASLADLDTAATEPEREPELGPLPEVISYDPELDAGTSPAPLGYDGQEVARLSPSAELDSLDDSNFGRTVEEIATLDKHRHWLTAQVASLRNNAVGLDPATREPITGATYTPAGGMRYGFTLDRMLFIEKSSTQDSLTLEGGLFLYKILDSNASAAYSVVPALATVRYNVQFGHKYGVFFYGGVMRNTVVSSTNGTDDTKGLLNSTFPAGGGGVTFTVGPNWEARADIGIDTLGAGLMLRF